MISTCAYLGVSTGLTSCTSYKFVPSQVVDNKLVILKNDFEESSFVMVKTDQLTEAIFVSKTGDKYLAVLTKCTHKGCEVRPAANILKCPCHGSEFDFEGKVLEGPAEERLRLFHVETDDEKIYIG
ncbi:MAG: ubiquinol-cytochrome c reductase iron-sulfur subunit [Bacteroidetes bacterium]|nr:ubiquinol-cytochrome c reductase iron-sulfur subunit [Bacteroidota bacterium]MDA1121818.1 ubiquinol-cytochrome c reductase iron-sulfur subunit [Bacteroidota bacterium]